MCVADGSILSVDIAAWRSASGVWRSACRVGRWLGSSGRATRGRWKPSFCHAEVSAVTV